MVVSDEQNNEMPPSYCLMFANRLGCYDISEEPGYSKELGEYFYYGGPGGPDCDTSFKWLQVKIE